jgi:cobalt-zinc-cadmium efflux system membrane fusion protein
MTGWIMVPPAHEVTLTAPLGGFVRASAMTGMLPVPGAAVRQGQELLRIEPVLSPLEQIQIAGLRRGVESDLKKARESIALAESDLKRVDELFKQKLRGQQDVEQAQTRLKLAQEDFATAEDKLKVFTAPGGNEKTGATALPITAPRAGTVLSVPSSPGQFVAAAAPLVTIADLSKPWVRVPVAEHDLPRVDKTRSLTVLVAGGADGPLRLQAAPVAQVPQVDLLRHTADLIFELEKSVKAPHFAKDQMVTVLMPEGETTEASLVPYAAVVFDAYGGTWVYVDRTADAAPQMMFERVRVELSASKGDDVVVRPLLKAGDRVVVEGAAALFSREFHRPPVK